MYIIKKDGMYLLGYLFTDAKEFIANGTLADIPMCIFGEHIKDAKVVNLTTARQLVEAIGPDAEYIKVNAVIIGGQAHED